MKKLQNTGEQPKGIAGEWRKADGSWRFVSGGKTYAGEWAWIYNPYAKEGQEKTSWFHFASDGRMQTGWFLDEKDGSWYYLRKTSDGNQGKMQTGWLKEGRKMVLPWTDGTNDKRDGTGSTENVTIWTRKTDICWRAV